MPAIPAAHRWAYSGPGSMLGMIVLVVGMGLMPNMSFCDKVFAVTAQPEDTSGVILLDFDVAIAEVVLDGRLIKLDLATPTRQVTIPHVDRSYSHWLEVSGQDSALPTKSLKIRPGDFQLKRRKDGREVYVAQKTVVFHSTKSNAGVMQYVSDGGPVITSVLAILVLLSADS